MVSILVTIPIMTPIVIVAVVAVTATVVSSSASCKVIVTILSIVVVKDCVELTACISTCANKFRNQFIPIGKSHNAMNLGALAVRSYCLSYFLALSNEIPFEI